MHQKTLKSFMKHLRLWSFITLFVLTISAFAEKHTEFYYQRASLFELLPIDSTDIVFLGNSLTNGCEWHELLGIPNVKNRGISGDIVQGVDERLTPVTNGHPAKIFFLTGVNDLSHDVPADSVATAILNVVDRIHAESPETKVYVQSLLPINNAFGRYKKVVGKEQDIIDINSTLAKECANHGATWINLYPSFADENGNLREDLTNDGLHLLGPGYLIWRDIVLPYVLE